MLSFFYAIKFPINFKTIIPIVTTIINLAGPHIKLPPFLNKSCMLFSVFIIRLKKEICSDKVTDIRAQSV